MFSDEKPQFFDEKLSNGEVFAQMGRFSLNLQKTGRFSPKSQSPENMWAFLRQRVGEEMPTCFLEIEIWAKTSPFSGD